MTPDFYNHRYSAPEIQLMLRAPGAGWLATLLTALDEAQHDPDFDSRQRAVLAQLAAGHGIPAAVVEAARRRTAAFELELELATSPTPQAGVA